MARQTPRRRWLAVALAATAVAASLIFLGYASACGGWQVEAPATEGSASTRECVPVVHPGLVLVAGLAVWGLVGVAAGRAAVPLAAGVVAGTLSSVFVFSIGAYTPAVALLLVAAGAVAAPHRRDLWVAAVVALAAEVALTVVVVEAGNAWGVHRRFPLVWVVFLMPALAWFGWLVARGRRERGSA